MSRWTWMVVLGMLVPAGGAAAAADVTDAVPIAAVDSASIHGVVRDSVTGEPLPGTIVRVLSVARQDMTHPGGEFHLVRLPAGTHTVVFERIGYARVVRDFVLAPGESISVEVRMRSSAIELPGIVVTGATRAGLGSQAVRPSDVLSGQELARKLDVTLANTLRNEPGLATTSVGPATARPIIRGLGGDRVLVLEDGARVGDLSSASSDHALSVDPLTAQRIEVVRGPNALLYGSNAIGGVINVIREEVPTSQPERPSGVLSVQGQTVNSGVGVGGSSQVGLGTFSVRGEGSYREAGDVSTPDGTLENTGLRTFSLSTGASHIVNNGHYGAAYRYYDNSYGIPGGFVGSHPEGVTVEMQRHSLHGQAERSGRVGPFDDLSLDAKYTNYYHRELESDGILGTEFGLLSAAVELLGKHDHTGPFDGGAVGMRIDWEDFAAGGSTQTSPSTSWTGALFIVEELSFGKLRVQGGGRYDLHRIEPHDRTTVRDIGEVRTRTFHAVAASLGALYELRDGVGMGASIARAYRTPDTNELFSQGPHLAAYSFEVGNPDLEAEVGLGVDVFVRVGRERYSAEAALFRNMLDNYIYYRDTGTRSPTGLPVYQATGADAVLQGFELSGSVEVLRHVVVSGMVSHVEGTNTGTDQPLPAIPPLRGHIDARYERPSWFLGLAWRAVAAQDRVDEFETPTPGHNVIDADAGYRWVAFGRVQSVTLSLDNVTDTVVYDHLSRIRDRDTDAQAPAPGFGANLIYRVVF